MEDLRRDPAALSTELQVVKVLWIKLAQLWLSIPITARRDPSLPCATERFILTAILEQPGLGQNTSSDSTALCGTSIRAIELCPKCPAWLEDVLDIDQDLESLNVRGFFLSGTGQINHSLDEATRMYHEVGAMLSKVLLTLRDSATPPPSPNVLTSWNNWCELVKSGCFDIQAAASLVSAHAQSDDTGDVRAASDNAMEDSPAPSTTTGHQLQREYFHVDVPLPPRPELPEHRLIRALSDPFVWPEPFARLDEHTVIGRRRIRGPPPGVAIDSDTRLTNLAALGIESVLMRMGVDAGSGVLVQAGQSHNDVAGNQTVVPALEASADGTSRLAQLSPGTIPQPESAIERRIVQLAQEVDGGEFGTMEQEDVSGELLEDEQDGEEVDEAEVDASDGC